MKVLHLSDFHIRDPDSDQEHLAHGVCGVYLGKLRKALEAYGTMPEVICITGDFIDRTPPENGSEEWCEDCELTGLDPTGDKWRLPEEKETRRWDHALRVVRMLAGEFSLGEGKVIPCHGNHDCAGLYDPTTAEDALKKARATFTDSVFAQPSHRSGSGGALYFTLTIDSQGSHFAVLDSCISAEKHSTPGVIAPADVDEFHEWIRDLPEDERLIVLSHFPVYFDTRANFAERKWTTERRWEQAASVTEALELRRRTSGAMWLSGDFHIQSGNPIYTEQGNVRYLTTGAFGIPVGRYWGAHRRQAQLVDWSKSMPDTITFEFDGQSVERQTRRGDWHYAYRNGQRLPDRSRTSSHVSRTLSGTESSDGARSNTEIQFQLLSNEIGEQIAAEVRETDAVRLGHYTSADAPDGRDILVAIDSAVLLADATNQRLLLQMCSSFRRLVAEPLIREHGHDRVRVFGIGVFGAILAAHLGMSSQLASNFVEERLDGAAISNSRDIFKTLSGLSAGPLHILIVCETLYSGRMVAEVLDDIKKNIPSGVELNCSVVALFCDRKSIKAEYLAGCELPVYVFCDSLRMPSIRTDEMPTTEKSRGLAVRFGHNT